MHRIPTMLMIAAAFAVCRPSMAQDPVQPRPDDARLQATPAPHARDANPARSDARAPRSAFGRVMAVMITSLQRQTRMREHPAPPVRTSAAGTPLDIEIGGAFRTAMDNAGAPVSPQSTATDDGASHDAPRAAPAEPPGSPVLATGPG